MIRLVSIVGVALLLGGCGTPLKEFKAPSDAKVKAATSDLNVKVARARETAANAKRATEEAKAIHVRMVAQAGTVKQLLAKLALDVPEQYRGPVRQVTDTVDQLIADNTALDEKLNQAVAWNTQLEQQLAAAEKARVTLQTAQDEYAGGAAQLARDATEERTRVVQLEKENAKAKLVKVLWKVFGGFAIVAIIGVVVLAIVGKLGVVLAKIGIKAAV